jgi:hypothetical protein
VRRHIPGSELRAVGAGQDDTARADEDTVGSTPGQAAC